jgi:hypothetical protein
MPPAISISSWRAWSCIAALATVSAVASLDAAFAQRETDSAALLRLSEQFSREVKAKQTPLYHSLLRSTDPVQQSLNRNPDIQLMYIRENGVPAYYEMFNIDAAKTVRTWDTWPAGVGGGVYSLTGSGTAGNEFAVWDGGGVLTTHQEFGGRVTQIDAPAATHYHSTHVAGTMVAGGVQANARGMSYMASLNAYEWTNDTAEMAAAAAVGLQISNHSYGFVAGWIWDSGGGYWLWYGDIAVSSNEDYGFGFYDTSARDWDNIAYSAPNYLICAAAGNDRDDAGPGPGGYHYHWNGSSWVWTNDTHGADGQSGGYDTIAWTSNAKNILTVGAVNDISAGYSVPGDVVQTAFSSWGPCDDGRIKPDIVANGWNLYSTTNTGNANYLTISGTSMATPNASGSINLLAGKFEFEYGRSPHSATLKALVINTADEAGANTGPDYANGWGLLNTKRAADVLAATGSDEMGLFEATLLNGEIDTYYFTVTSPQDVRLTVAWTDPAGTPPAGSLDPATPMLVNDLDVRITNLTSGTTTMPWTLNRAAPAAAAVQADNVVDNVEQIDIASAAAAIYRVTVIHKGALSGGSQAYSMVWRGMLATQPEETAWGQHGTVDLAAPDFPADHVSSNRGQDRSVFITAIEDFNLTGIAMKIAFPFEQTVTASLYAANGTTRGAMLASNAMTVIHPGHVFHFVPISYQLQACQEYELVVIFDRPVSWPWWSESTIDPPAIVEPFDAGGAIRVRDGALNAAASNYALPNFAVQGIANPTVTWTDLSPASGAWTNVTDPAQYDKRGIYVRPERTVTLDVVGFAAAFAVLQDVTMRVRVFDGTGMVRGALLAEGYKHFTNGLSTAMLIRTIPVSIVLEEGEVYDVEVQFPGGSTWEGQSEIGKTPFTNDPIRVLDGERVGNIANSYMAHFQFAWTEDAGGEPHDLTRSGPAYANSAQDNYDYGMYVTSMINQQLYSLGWKADVPEGAIVGMRVYEATGNTRGSLISEGQVFSSGSGFRWHDVPVAATLLAGHDYDFEINITTVDRWDWWEDDTGFLPYTPYGLIQVRNSEQGGDPANIALPQIRVNMCNTTATPVLDRPANVPKFTLAAPYPNPVAGIATIDFSLDKAEPVTINVYDVAGRHVSTILQKQSRIAGPGQVNFDTKGLASGVYFIKMQTPSKYVTRKITVLR